MLTNSLKIVIFFAQNFQILRCNGAKSVEVEATPFKICKLETSHPNKSLLHQVLGWNIEEENTKPQISTEKVFEPNGNSSNAEDCQADGGSSDDQDVGTNPAVSTEPETKSSLKFLCMECQPPHTFSNEKKIWEHMTVTDHSNIDAIGSE